MHTSEMIKINIKKNTKHSIRLLSLLLFIASSVSYGATLYRGGYSQSSHYKNIKNEYRGDIKWDVELSKHAILISPIFDSQNIYVTSNDNKLFSIDKLNGNLNWSRHLEYPITSQLFIFGETLIAGNNNGEIIFFNINNGKKEKKIQKEGSIFGPFIKSGDYLIAGNNEGIIYSINIKTLKEKSQIKLNTQIGPPLFFKSKLIIPSSSIYCGAIINIYDFIDGIFGEPVQFQTDLNYLSLPILVDGKMYASGLGSSGSLTKLNVFDLVQENYQELFEIETTSHLASNGEAIIFTDNKSIYAMDNNHDLLWGYDLGELITRYASLSHNNAYIPTQKSIHGFSIKNGDLKWTHEGPYIISTALILDKKALYYGTKEGRLVALH